MFLYLQKKGWYLSRQDIALTALDVFLLVLFGTALSSVVDHFLTTQGQMSAIGTIVSSAYGFLCGAYMPISQFSEGIRSFISFLPGTYGTILLHNHLMRGVFAELEANGIPPEMARELARAFDNSIALNGNVLTQGQMYLILIASIAVLIGLYILMNALQGRKETA